MEEIQNTLIPTPSNAMHADRAACGGASPYRRASAVWHATAMVLLCLCVGPLQAQTQTASGTLCPTPEGDHWVMYLSWTSTNGFASDNNHKLNDPYISGNTKYELTNGPLAGALVGFGNTTPGSNSTTLVEWSDPLRDTPNVTNPPSISPQWIDLGDYIVSRNPISYLNRGNNSLAYGSGVAGVESLTSEPAGVMLDHDSGLGDDLGPMVYGTNRPPVGAIVVRAPLPTIPTNIPFTDIFILGTHTNNPVIRLTVTNQPFTATADIRPTESGRGWIASIAWSDTSTMTVLDDPTLTLDAPAVVGDNTYRLSSGPFAGAEVRYGTGVPASNSSAQIAWSDPLADDPTNSPSPSVALKWDDVGDFIGHQDLTFGSGVAGVQALTGEPAGVYFDDDAQDGVSKDDIGLLLPGTNMPSSGACIVTGPLPPGVRFSHMFKRGTYTGNPQMLLTIHADPYHSNGAVLSIR